MIKKSSIYWLFFITLVLMGIFHFHHDPEFTLIHLAIHLPAILGVTSLFIAILIPLLKDRIVLTKPDSTLSLHHLFSYMAWTSIVVHMVFLFVKIKQYTLYVPSFVSWQVMLQKSGPIAVILLILGALALFLIKRWKTFQLIHAINIIAFLWISLHGVIKDDLIGSNYPHLYLLIVMDLVIIVALIANAFKKRK